MSRVEILVRTPTTLLSSSLFRAPPCKCPHNTLTYDHFTSHDFQFPDSQVIRSGITGRVLCIIKSFCIPFKKTVSCYRKKYELKYENNFIQFIYTFICIFNVRGGDLKANCKR